MEVGNVNALAGEPGVKKTWVGIAFATARLNTGGRPSQNMQNVSSSLSMVPQEFRSAWRAPPPAVDSGPEAYLRRASRSIAGPSIPDLAGLSPMPMAQATGHEFEVSGAGSRMVREIRRELLWFAGIESGESRNR